MKKYNIYEIRFLQVLVPKKEHDKIMLEQWYIRTEEYLWRGIHDEQKKELLLNAGDICEVSASGDYLDAIKHAIEALKKAGFSGSDGVLTDWKGDIKFEREE